MKYLVFILTMVMVACQPSVNEKVYLIEGEAQGSTYHIKYIAERDENLKPAIDSILEVIDLSMSTYRPDSAISKINQGDTTVVVDEHFAWGFGKQKISEADLPTDKKIDSLRKYVGFDKVALTEKNLIKKRYTEILFDFNAIAQGYTSDVVANYLSARGIKNYIVEIAGEMYLKGKNTVEDKSWTIGVENPLKPLDDHDLVATIQFTNQGLATSGNYRKVWTDSNGRKYVHSINPLTGRATQSDVLSATVVAPSTMLADGYATMFMVMGLAQSKAFLEKHPDFAVLLVYSDDKHQEATYKTKAFEKLIIH